VTGFDIAVLAIVAFFGVIGWIRGFSWQLVGVATLVLGFTVAYPLSGLLEPTMARWLGYEMGGADMQGLAPAHQGDIRFLARGAAWGTAFALIWLFTHACYYFFREAIENWHMEELNRTLGGVFGVVKGLLVVAAMTLALVILGVERTRTSPTTVRVGVPALLDRSVTAPVVIRTMRAVRFAFPSAFGTGMGHYLDALGALDEEHRTAEVREDGGGGPVKPDAEPGAKPPANGSSPAAGG